MSSASSHFQFLSISSGISYIKFHKIIWYIMLMLPILILDVSLLLSALYHIWPWYFLPVILLICFLNNILFEMVIPRCFLSVL